MKHKLTVFIASMICLAASVLWFTHVKVKFFPDFDYNQLYVEYTLPSQTSSERVKHDLMEITGKLSAYDEIVKIGVSQGGTPGRYSLTRATTYGGDHYGEILLFNSIKKMLLILFCLPFAAIGLVIGLQLTDTPITFMGIIGMIGLLGMLIKNAIVLVDEITRMIKEKVDPYTAIIESTINRTRPVIMASLTTILGMLPLIFDPMYSSLAVTVIGGLSFGTIITLVLLPIFFAIFFKIKNPQTR